MPSVVSSNVSSVDYDDVRSVMTVTFNNGSVYEYSQVPKEIYDLVLTSPSIGASMHAFVKGKYSYRRIA